MNHNDSVWFSPCADFETGPSAVGLKHTEKATPLNTSFISKIGYSVFLSLFLSLAQVLSLSVVDWNYVKVDRWAWQLDNSSSSSVLHSLTRPHPASSISEDHPAFPPLSLLVPSSFILLFMQTFIVNMCPEICPVPPCFIPFHSLHSFIQCHYGPVLTEAFIKCQLYTRDHTVEGEETMISDPKRSTCWWALSSCWRTVCIQKDERKF